MMDILKATVQKLVQEVVRERLQRTFEQGPNQDADLSRIAESLDATLTELGSLVPEYFTPKTRTIVARALLLAQRIEDSLTQWMANSIDMMGESQRRIEAAFMVGDFVRSNTNTQGLVKGQIYTIEEIDEHPEVSGPWGDVISYVVEDESGNQLTIGNAHLLLSKAEEA